MKNSRVYLRVKCLICLLGVFLVTISMVAVRAGEPVHYLVFEVAEDGTVDPVFHRLVELPSWPTSSTDAEQLKAQEENAGLETLVTLKVISSQGEIVHRGIAEWPRWLRGEFHGEQRTDGAWSINSHRLPVQRPVFVARIPAIPGSRLIVEGTVRSTFDLDEVMERAGELRLAELANIPVSKRIQGGVSSNRVDLLVMGDGYTAAQRTQFNSEVVTQINDFFSITPYAEYKNFVNVTSLFSASAESGADHPPYNPSCTGDNPSCCADSTMLSDPLAGTFVDTAFSARFCSFNIHRLLVVDTSRVLAVASAVPTWDRIMIIVNDTTYGGAGGFISVNSTHALGVGISQHEYGHSFTDLADEYDSAFPGFPACSDVSSPPCEANVTDETNSGLLKWAPWVSPATPIPTPEISTYFLDVGLFQGARYLTSGMYRPRNTSCLMHFLGMPFGEICSQEYVRVLYQGGWGDPAGGIDLIEPGSENPPTTGIIDGTGGVTISVDLLQPIGGPPLGVTWLVNGVPQIGSSASFNFTPPGPGTYAVQVQVEDTTTLVNPAMAGLLLHSVRNWTVESMAAVDPGRILDDILVDKTVTPGVVRISWSAGCSTGAQDYAIYEGAIGDFSNHGQRTCTDSGVALTEEITPDPGSRYFIVVPLNSSFEGSYGTNSAGVERQQAALACVSSQAPGICL